MPYTKPSVLVYQEFATAPAELTNPLRACIHGPNADLHRHAVASEKAGISLGAYDPNANHAYDWPGRNAGGIVDPTYTKVFVDNAKLRYFMDTIGSDSVISPVAGRANRIQSSVVSFKSNGSAYPRSALLNDRDVQIGDLVYLRSVGPSPDCVVTELNTYVIGFDGVPANAVTAAAEADDGNQGGTSSSTTINKIGGPDNCILASANGSAYNGLPDGYVSEQYTITVVKSSVPGCDAAELRVVSASGTDDQASVTPSAYGAPTPIGTRGLTVTFSFGGAGCSAAAEEDDVDPESLVVGQQWQVTTRQAYTAPTATSSGTYTGDNDDIYIATVTRGGTYASQPEITITTAKGLDFSGPVAVTGSGVDVSIGRYGVKIRFTGGTGLRTGDKFLIAVTASVTGELRTLILKNDLPADMQTASDLDLSLFIKTNIQLPEERFDSAPDVNWSQTSLQLTVNEGALVTYPEWTSDGVLVPIELVDGDMYVEFRDWLPTLVGTLNRINDPGAIDTIPGPLDIDNPLKWGVYRALTKSNGTAVAFTAVADPTLLTDWTDSLAVVKGQTSVYNLVPTTFDTNVCAAFLAQADADSSPAAAAWKACFFALQATLSKAAVSQATSTNNGVVLATLADNPSATGTQYTLLQVPAGNGQFLTNNVSPGDTVRYLYTTDGFGNTAWSEFVVDSVLSEDSLLLLTGHTVAISVAQKIEIWHTLNKNEIVADLLQKKSAFANKRACCVWPDVAGAGGVLEPGYFLCCDLAGMVSGVAPHQPLTNVQVDGYDDLSRASKFFNAAQLDDLAGGGVWIVTQDSAGNVYTRHALTGDMTDINSREEMIRRNDDSISYFFYNRMAPFIGRCNVSPALLRRLGYELQSGIDYLTNNYYTEELGGQVIAGTIVSLTQDPLLLDHVNAVLNLTRPAPLNNLDLHLVG